MANKMHNLQPMLGDLKVTETSFSPFSTVWWHLQLAEMPRSHNLVIFVPTDNDNDNDNRWTNLITLSLVHVHRVIIIVNYSLAGQPLHREEGSGTAPLLELFCWNAINPHGITLSNACFRFAVTR